MDIKKLEKELGELRPRKKRVWQSMHEWVGKPRRVMRKGGRPATAKDKFEDTKACPVTAQDVFVKLNMEAGWKHGV